MIDRIKVILKEHRKNPIRMDGFVTAAILIPLFLCDQKWYLLFTKRTEKVETHKGQISFPGGSFDKEDKNLLMTALRESEEELGILPKDVEILGELDDYVTGTNFVITPFVGIIPYPYKLKLNENEIAEIIEVPFEFFMDEKNLRVEIWEREGFKRPVYFYDFGGHTIWGVTGEILKMFIDLISK